MRRDLLISTVLVVWAFASLALADTIYVDWAGGGDYETIAAGISAAGDGDIVLVAPGTYTGPSNRDLTFYYSINIEIRGSGGSANTIIDCENQGRGFVIGCGQDDRTIVEGFTIKNGSALDGAGAYCFGTEPQFIDIHFLDNHATHKGGGLFCDGASPTLSGVNFTGNEASSGGGIYVKDYDDPPPDWEGAPSLEAVTFSSNDASFGGAIYCDSGTEVFLHTVTFDSNTADVGGGIFCCDHSEINTILAPATGVTFAHNCAYGNGGAIYFCNLGAGYFDSAVLYGNAAGVPYPRGDDTTTPFESTDLARDHDFYSGDGGAVYCNDTTTWLRIEFTGGQFLGNTAASNGGGVFCTSGEPRFDGISFQLNQAASGGGMFVTGGSYVVVANSWFVQNSADEWGGGICALGANLPLLQLLFMHNSAFRGGGMYCHQTQSGLTDVSFQDNTAVDGGGAYWKASFVAATNTTFDSNEATTGGGLYSIKSVVYVDGGGEFKDNVAAANGGAVHCTICDVMSFEGISFESNHSGHSGGAAACSGSNVSFTDSDFLTNTSSFNGGAVLCGNASEVNFNGSDLVGNSSLSHGGAIYCAGASASFANLVFEVNRTEPESPTGTAHGGAIYCGGDGEITLFNVELNGNSAAETQGAGHGGGVYTCGTSVSNFWQVVFSGNSATNGGGLCCEAINPTLYSNLNYVSFIGNEASNDGGGLYTWNNTLVSIWIAEFFDNTAADKGGGMCCVATPQTWVQACHATFAANQAASGAGVFCGDGAWPILSTSILAFNTGDAIKCSKGSYPTIERCCVHGNTAGDDLCGDYSSIIYDDPRFCDLGGGDLTLHDNSPCLPENNEWEVLIGAYGAGGCGSSRDQLDGETDEHAGSVLPERFVLRPPAPNPSSGETTIRYSVPCGEGNLSVGIYNMKGQLVKVIADGPRPAGHYEFAWDGKNVAGVPVASGVYFCRAIHGSDAVRRKLVLIR